MKKSLRSLAATLAATAVVAAGVGTAAPASAAEPGTRSLAKVLAADSGFDRNAQDFDVLERAVTFVLERRPESPVGLLAQGNKRATVFLPTDQAFARLVNALTDERPASERATWQATRTVGAEALEGILLYHVIPGATKPKAGVLKARGTRVDVANGDSVRINVRRGHVFIGDRAPKAKNAEVVAFNINQGNKQIGHAVDRVLRPAPLN